MVPVSVSLEASVRVADLGMQRELERMLAHASQTVAGVRGIAVTLIPPCDPGEEPRVVLEVTKDEPQEGSDPLWREWCDWMVETFPSGVLRHFNLLTVASISP